MSGSVAWSDESMLMGLPRPVYMIAATVCLGEPDVSALEGLNPKGSGKLHWRKMDSRQRVRVTRAMSAIGANHTVVVGCPASPKKQERARVMCLKRLIPLLEERGVGVLVMESRGKQNDMRDIEHFRHMRVAGEAKGMRVEHRSPAEDHMLWLPDQVLGAYGEVAYGNPSHALEEVWVELEPMVEVVEFKLT